MGSIPILHTIQILTPKGFLFFFLGGGCLRYGLLSISPAAGGGILPSGGWRQKVRCGQAWKSRESSERVVGVAVSQFRRVNGLFQLNSGCHFP